MKILFKIIDYSLALLMGVGTVLLVSLVVGEGWNMFVAMSVGMLLGMILLIFVIVLSCGVTSIFDIMPTGMVITMFTGMAVGMSIAAGSASMARLYMGTLLFALFAQFTIDLYNLKLKGEVPLDNA